jgi:hypothetical protein
MSDYIDIVFDGPPSERSGRLIEVESPAGKSIRIGEWIDRGDGTWALRITRDDIPAQPVALT